MGAEMPQGRSARLDTVAKVSGYAEDACARVLAECRRRLDAKTVQVRELQDYHDDYVNQTRAMTGQTVSAQLFGDRAQFLNQLRIAIEHEQKAKRQIEAELEAYVQRWQAAHSRAEALRTLCVQDAQRVDKARDLGEQREIEDAFQSRLHRSAAA